VTSREVEQHVPNRPGWDCRCGQPWPCEPRREQLQAEVDRDDRNWVTVHTLLRQQLSLAMMELCHLSAEEVVERFTGWLKRPGSAPGGTLVSH
jgi:hypothetical protein